MDDSNLKQPHIPFDDDEFFSRSNFETKLRIISVGFPLLEDQKTEMTPSPQPKLGDHSCCCNVPYDTTACPLMHFCPRPTCRRYFHPSCLIKDGYRDPDTADRAYRLLFASPDLNGDSDFVVRQREEEVVERQLSPGRSIKRVRVGTPLDEDRLTLVIPEKEDNPHEPTSSQTRSANTTRGRRRGRGRGRGLGDSNGVNSIKTSISTPPVHYPTGPIGPSVFDPDATEMLLASLPPDLVRIAQQPIVRGRAFYAGGLSGNLSAVVAARRTVYTALLRREAGEDAKNYGLDGWEERVGPIERALVKLKNSDRLDDAGRRSKAQGKGRRGRKRKGSEEEEGIIPLLCPLCRCAI
ncbi:hypothetical protein H0H87_002136 [Tephrocybe sp. NHM501043]|nr:hypothetical protein H0H87_002136 [Tephrocybe sp. NHM501043]